MTMKKTQYLIAINGLTSEIKRIEIWIETDLMDSAIKIASKAFNVDEMFIIKADVRTAVYNENNELVKYE